MYNILGLPVVAGALYLVDAVAGKGALRFVCEDEAACAAQVLFPEPGLQKDLPLGKPVVLRLVAPKPGDYAFQCRMGMYRGVLRAIKG